MPKKPRINHPVRQVRTCLGLSQPEFAKRIGCSAIAIQRIENGSLPLSAKLAYAIAEATGADWKILQQGPNAQALDWLGGPYTKDSLQLLKNVLPMTEKELQYQFHEHFRFMELLFIASARGGQYKTHAVIAAVQDAFKSIAHDFKLKSGIDAFLTERASMDKRKYRVSDLRKFPDYARILGFKDKKSYRPEKVIEFTILKGWILNYILEEAPVLPHGADMKLRDAEYILDYDRPIPQYIKEAIGQAIYWEIKSFTPLP